MTENEKTTNVACVRDLTWSLLISIEYIHISITTYSKSDATGVRFTN